MKKLLGIVVLGLLLSFNTYAADKNLYLKCPETLQKIRIGEGALLKKGTLIGTNYVKLKSKSIITIHFNYEITKDKPFIIIENYRVKNDEIGFTATEKYKDKDYDSLDIYRFVQVENGYVFTHNGDATFGTTTLTVSQFSGAGQIIAGTSLTKTGNTMNVATDGTTMFTLSDSLSVQSSGTAGQILRSTGNTGQAAVYGQLDLANSNAVTGITAVANGGTGKNSVTAHLLMVGNGTSALNTVAIGTSGQALLSGGSGSNPAFGDIDGGTF